MDKKERGVTCGNCMDFSNELDAYPIKTDGVDFAAAYRLLGSNPESFYQFQSPEGWVTSISMTPQYRQWLTQGNPGPLPDNMPPKYTILTGYHRDGSNLIPSEKPYSAVTTTGYISDFADPAQTTFKETQLYGYEDRSKFVTIYGPTDFRVTERDENLAAHVKGSNGMKFDSLTISYARGSGEPEPFNTFEIIPSNIQSAGYQPQEQEIPGYIAKQGDKPTPVADAIACAGKVLRRLDMQEVVRLPESDKACTLVPGIKPPVKNNELK